MKYFIIAFLCLLNNIALARPAMSDVYEDSCGYGFWIVLLIAGWILKKMLGDKDGSSMQYGLLIMMAIVGIVIITGLGNAFIGVALKYPLLAVAAIIFVIWANNKK